MNTAVKPTAKVLTNIINELTTLSDEQQRFRYERSCVDALFVLRQITEKAIDYNKTGLSILNRLDKGFRLHPSERYIISII